MKNELTRRSLLRTIGLGLAAAPVVHLLGCAGGSASGGGATANGVTGVGGVTGAGWATGGTAAMKGGYVDPFVARAAPSACKLTCWATVGPCYAKTLVRRDISEGHRGLPTRLAFLVLDDACKPIPNAEVDIWHAAPEGVYSGEDAEAMCTASDAKAVAARWFRGKQTTDAKGRVDFDTCFPGWYRGRTVHVHFTVRVGGTEHVTSQLVFDDVLVDSIVATQVGYTSRGARDTTNKNDGVLSATEVSDYVFETARQSDGAMLAWKTLILASAGSATCATTGGGGPGGPGGPRGPGGGPPPGGGSPPDGGGAPRGGGGPRPRQP